MAEEIKAGILTLSDKGSRGEREDLSGAAIRELLASIGAVVERYDVIPDELELIKQALAAWCDLHHLDLIVTTGGTGFAPRDVTPEATRAVIEREAPGLAEAMRAAGLKKTPRAMLSRAVAGIRGRTLIINLPGSVKGVRESLTAILPALPHAIEILAGKGGECGR
ncbi:MAG TPA: MogA/MoaB family molybdenum cofactor biosynthesis protein [bacterium]|nr:MogA/MoaB family molybdenum cofactor biosynthesis protein [bacterium]